jgi:hypothetical protein
MIKPDFAIREINVKHPTILFLATLGELNIDFGDSLLLLLLFEKSGEKELDFFFAI